jgi:hypothetical protein
VIYDRESHRTYERGRAAEIEAEIRRLEARRPDRSWMTESEWWDDYRRRAILELKRVSP